MRILYREEKYDCESYIDIDIYPVFGKQKSRAKKMKPSSEMQQSLNRRRAEKRYLRMLHVNFLPGDYIVHLTYDDDNLPVGPDAEARAFADKDNFLRRVYRLYKKNGKSKPLVMGVFEYGEKSGRMHFHIHMQGGVTRDEVEKLWKFGDCNCDRLRFTEKGIERLAVYTSKQFRKKQEQNPNKKKWFASRGLRQPEPEFRTGRISAKKIKELATISVNCSADVEKIYPNCTLIESRGGYNEINGGYYVNLKLYKKPKKERK